MWTRESLAKHVADGSKAKFLFFWGHTPRSVGAIDASCLSQWFPAAFTIAGTRYATAEHFMMAEKARLFRDDAALDKVLAARTPDAAKTIGRTVLRYDDAQWDRVRLQAVVAGNVAKFSQNGALERYLVGTGERVLVEASPLDRVWGIGLAASDPNAADPRRWRGRNLLGFALMEARKQLGART